MITTSSLGPDRMISPAILPLLLTIFRLGLGPLFRSHFWCSKTEEGIARLESISQDPFTGLCCSMISRKLTLACVDVEELGPAEEVEATGAFW
jgi:hypothetical protein